MEIASKLAELMRYSSYVVALTGAGMSTESGISDYRGPKGIWTTDPSAEARAYEAYQVFTEDPERYWREGYGTHPLYDDFMNAEPNSGHISLAQLERTGYVRSVITQNIDNLHLKAGSSNVIEYHGNVTLLRCMECGTRDRRSNHASVLCDNGVPHCPMCGAPMKSDVVHFGEPIPTDVAKKGQEEMFKADMLLICGTSAVVHPFASLPEIARYYRKDTVTMVEVNLSDTPLSHMVEYPVRASTSEVLSAIASRLI